MRIWMFIRIFCLMEIPLTILTLQLFMDQMLLILFLVFFQLVFMRLITRNYFMLLLFYFCHAFSRFMRNLMTWLLLLMLLNRCFHGLIFKRRMLMGIYIQRNISIRINLLFIVLLTMFIIFSLGLILQWINILNLIIFH